MKNGEQFVCSCGFSKQIESQVITSEKIGQFPIKGEGVAEKKEGGIGFVHKCEKCGHMYAEFIDLGEFYPDESSIHLFRCKKCGYSKRESYGSSSS